MGTPNYLVTFDNVSAAIGGIELSAIAELRLAASANGVPALTLLVDPNQPSKGEAEALSSTGLADAARNVEGYRSMVKSEATLELSFLVNTIPGAQEWFSLTGWVLTDVSLSPVEMHGVCYASLTFMHPICKADFGGAVPGLLSTSDTLLPLAGKDPFSAFTAALNAYANAPRNPPEDVSGGIGTSPAAVQKTVIDKLQSATQALQATVAWEGGAGLPCVSQLIGWSDFIAKGLAVYAAPSEGSSVLNRFLGQFVPECSLALGGDYTQPKLSLTKFEPWADPSLYISDGAILSMQFPQKDPAPLSGVSMVTLGTDNATGPSWHRETKQLSLKPASIFYVPRSELDAPYMYGPIYRMSEPAWLVSARSYMLAASDTGKSDAGGGFNSPSTIGRDQAAPVSSVPNGGESQKYNRAMLACAKAFYTTLLMKDFTFTLTLPLTFDVSGGKLCPGKVLSVESDGNSVVTGYVTSVIHVVSVPSRTATTVVTCAYPRIPDRPEGIEDTKNALYT